MARARLPGSVKLYPTSCITPLSPAVLVQSAFAVLNLPLMRNFFMTRRRYLTHHEVSDMLNAVRNGTNGARNYSLILMAFRHGMRISELLALRYKDMDLQAGRIYIHRLKNGFSTVHPLMPDELDSLQVWTSIRSTWRGQIKRMLSTSLVMDGR